MVVSTNTDPSQEPFVPLSSELVGGVSPSGSAFQIEFESVAGKPFRTGVSPPLYATAKVCPGGYLIATAYPHLEKCTVEPVRAMKQTTSVHRSDPSTTPDSGGGGTHTDVVSLGSTVPPPPGFSFTSEVSAAGFQTFRSSFKPVEFSVIAAEEGYITSVQLLVDGPSSSSSASSAPPAKERRPGLTLLDSHPQPLPYVHLLIGTSTGVVLVGDVVRGSILAIAALHNSAKKDRPGGAPPPSGGLLRRSSIPSITSFPPSVGGGQDGELLEAADTLRSRPIGSEARKWELSWTGEKGEGAGGGGAPPLLVHSGKEAKGGSGGEEDTPAAARSSASTPTDPRETRCRRPLASPSASFSMTSRSMAEDDLEAQPVFSRPMDENTNKEEEEEEEENKKSATSHTDGESARAVAAAMRPLLQSTSPSLAEEAEEADHRARLVMPPLQASTTDEPLLLHPSSSSPSRPPLSSLLPSPQATSHAGSVGARGGGGGGDGPPPLFSSSSSSFPALACAEDDGASIVAFVPWGFPTAQEEKGGGDGIAGQSAHRVVLSLQGVWVVHQSGQLESLHREVLDVFLQVAEEEAGKSRRFAARRPSLKKWVVADTNTILPAVGPAASFMALVEVLYQTEDLFSFGGGGGATPTTTPTTADPSGMGGGALLSASLGTTSTSLPLTSTPHYRDRNASYGNRQNNLGASSSRLSPSTVSSPSHAAYPPSGGRVKRVCGAAFFTPVSPFRDDTRGGGGGGGGGGDGGGRKQGGGGGMATAAAGDGPPCLLLCGTAPSVCFYPLHARDGTWRDGVKHVVNAASRFLSRYIASPFQNNRPTAPEWVKLTLQRYFGDPQLAFHTVQVDPTQEWAVLYAEEVGEVFLLHLSSGAIRRTWSSRHGHRPLQCQFFTRRVQHQWRVFLVLHFPSTSSSSLGSAAPFLPSASLSAAPPPPSSSPTAASENGVLEVYDMQHLDCVARWCIPEEVLLLPSPILNAATIPGRETRQSGSGGVGGSSLTSYPNSSSSRGKRGDVAASSARGGFGEEVLWLIPSLGTIYRLGFDATQLVLRERDITRRNVLEANDVVQQAWSRVGPQTSGSAPLPVASFTARGGEEEAAASQLPLSTADPLASPFFASPSIARTLAPTPPWSPTPTPHTGPAVAPVSRRSSVTSPPEEGEDVWTAMGRIASRSLIDHEVLIDILITCQVPIDFFDCAMNIPLPSYQPKGSIRGAHPHAKEEEKEEEEVAVASPAPDPSRSTSPTAYDPPDCWPLKMVEECQEYVQLVQQIRQWLQWQFAPGHSASRWLPLPPSALTTAVSTGAWQLPAGLTAGQALHYLHHQMALVCAYRALVLPAPVESRLRALSSALDPPTKKKRNLQKKSPDLLSSPPEETAPPNDAPPPMPSLTPPLLRTAAVLHPVLKAYGLPTSLYDLPMRRVPSSSSTTTGSEAPHTNPFWKQRFRHVARQWSSPPFAVPEDHGPSLHDQGEAHREGTVAGGPPVVGSDASILWHRVWPRLFGEEVEEEVLSTSTSSASVFSYTVLPLSRFQSYFFCGTEAILFRRDRLFREEWARNCACGEEDGGGGGGTNTTAAALLPPMERRGKKEDGGWSWLGELVYGQYGLGAFPFQLPPLRRLGCAMRDVARLTVAWVTDTCARVGTHRFLATIPLGTFVSTFLMVSHDALLEAMQETPLAMVSPSLEVLCETRCRVEALLLMAVVRCAGAAPHGSTFSSRGGAEGLGKAATMAVSSPPALGVAVSLAAAVVEPEVPSLPSQLEKYVAHVVDTMRAARESSARWGDGETMARGAASPSHRREEEEAEETASPTPKKKTKKIIIKRNPLASQGAGGKRKWYTHDPFLLCVSRCVRLWMVLTEEAHTLCISQDTWKEVIQRTRVLEPVATTADGYFGGGEVGLIPFRLSMLTSLPGGVPAPSALSTTVEEYILEATGMDFARVHRLEPYFAEKPIACRPGDQNDPKEEEKSPSPPLRSSGGNGETSWLNYWQLAELLYVCGVPDLFASTQHFYEVQQQVAQRAHEARILQQIRERNEGHQQERDGRRHESAHHHHPPSARGGGGGTSSSTSRERAASGAFSRHSSLSASPSSSASAFPSVMGGGRYDPPPSPPLSRYTSSYFPPRVWPWIQAEGQWNRDAFDTVVRVPLKAMWESLTRSPSMGNEKEARGPHRSGSSGSTPHPVSPVSHLTREEAEGVPRRNEGGAKPTDRAAPSLESGEMDTCAGAALFDQVGFFIALLSVVEQLLQPLLSRLPLFWDSNTIPRLDFLSVLPPDHARRHAASFSSSVGTPPPPSQNEEKGSRMPKMSLSPSSHLRPSFSTPTSTTSTPERRGTPKEGGGGGSPPPHPATGSPPREDAPPPQHTSGGPPTPSPPHRAPDLRPPPPLCLSGTRAAHAYLTSLMDMLELVSMVHHRLGLDGDATPWQLEKVLPLCMMKADTDAFRGMPTGLWERFFLFLSLIAETPKRIQVLTQQYMRLLHLMQYFMHSSALQVEGIPVHFFSVYMPWRSLIGPLEGLHYLPSLSLHGGGEGEGGGGRHRHSHRGIFPPPGDEMEPQKTHSSEHERAVSGSPLAAVFRAAGWTPRSSAMRAAESGGGPLERRMPHVMDDDNGPSRSPAAHAAVTESALAEEKGRWNLITETLRQFVMDGLLLPVMDKLSPAAATLLFQRHSHGGGVLRQGGGGREGSLSHRHSSSSDSRLGVVPPVAARALSGSGSRNERWGGGGGSQKGSPLMHALSIPAFDPEVLRRLQHPETYLVMVQFAAVLGLNENVAALVILDFHLKYLSDISYIVQQLEMEKNNTATPHLVVAHLQTMLYVVYDFVEKCESDTTIPPGPRRIALFEARRRLNLSSSFKSWLKLAVPEANPQSVYYRHQHHRRLQEDESKLFANWHPTVDKEERETMASYLVRRELQLKVLEEGIDWFSPGELSVYTTLVHLIIKSHTPDTIDRLKSTLLHLKEVAFAISPPLLGSAGSVAGKMNAIQMFAPDITSLIELIVSAI